jgi:hypothetical protein
MTGLRKWRFPVLIGGGVVAAGILFYLADAHVSSRATQGTIAHRDVYREGDVKPGDVGTPGAAPVAIQAVLQSKDFQKLAKNQAFQGVMNNNAFQEMSRNAAFWNLLKNDAFANLTQNTQFQVAMRNEALTSKLVASHSQGMTASLRNELLASNVQDLANNGSFNALLVDKSFNELLRQASFTQLLASHQFQALMGNASFLTLASSAGFQNALMSGSAASLTAAMDSNLNSHLNRQ